MAYGLTKSANLVPASSQYFSAADSASLSVTGDVTLECWVRFNALSGTQWIASKKADDDNYDCYSIYVTTTALSARFYNGTNYEDETVSWTASTGTWYHLAVVRSGTSVLFYVNGSQQGSTQTQTTVTGALQNSTAIFAIGRYRAADGRYFDGDISLVRVWNVARSSGDISANMCTVYGTGTTNMQAEWSLNDVVTDASGNSNTLTNNGTATFTTALPSTCAASGPTNLKSLDTNLKANIKSYNTNLIANVKSINTNA